MKKKVFRTHPVLVIEGRAFLLILTIGASLLVYVMLTAEKSGELYIDVLCYLFGIAMVVGVALVNVYFWRIIWGKLIITETGLVWKCLFCKKIYIPYNEIRYVELRAFKEGNSMRYCDLYRTGFMYMLISTDPLPRKNINRIESKGNLIKFPCFTKKIRDAMKEVLPSPFKSRFSLR